MMGQLLEAKRFRALGTGCRVVADEEAIEDALDATLAQLGAIDFACSRFRNDSELTFLNRRAGDWVHVSGLFLRALDVAIRAAQRTNGAVDPTIGNAMKAIGYDKDFALIGGSAHRVTIESVPGWKSIEIDTIERRVRIPRNTSLDFGATAKALAADMAAEAAARKTGQGVLISLGGDIAVAGETPSGGWIVDVGEAHDGFEIFESVNFDTGGLATSSTAVRRWTAYQGSGGGKPMHHIVDPATGLPALGPWRNVSVFADSCVDANVASTAAIIKGDRAIDWLRGQNLPARLTANNGEVVKLNDWPKG